MTESAFAVHPFELGAALEILHWTPRTLDGTHRGFGRVTLAQVISTWAVHDLSHVAQISRVMAKQYKQAVGPWTEYLPILNKQESR